MKLKKMDLPKRQETIIRRALERNLDEITPNIIPEKLTYQKMEDLVEEYGLKDFQKSLKALSNKGFLEEREYARVIFCPECNSLHVHSKYSCPKCNSVNVTRNELIQHTHCGFIGNRKRFKKNGRLICPNCGIDLGSAEEEPDFFGDKSFNIIGTSFICDECGHNFEKPNVVHNCIKCGAVFNHKKALYEKLYAYSLTEEAKKTSSQPESLGLLREISETLQNHDYVVDSPGELTGQSGVVQEFNILARRKKETLVLDVSDGEQTDLISLLGKKLDVAADKAILVDFSGKMKKTELAENQNILLLNGKEGNIQKDLVEYINHNKKKGIRSLF